MGVPEEARLLYFSARLSRRSNGEPLEGETMQFQVNGPTCDTTNALPGPVPLPDNISPGDYLEFGNIGAHSIGGRTDYNGSQ